MTRIAVNRRMQLPHETVWEALADLGSHTDWMKDAQWIVFVSDQRSGIGTRMEVKTLVGPFHTIDVMTVVGWEEGRSIEVVHSGVVKGTGTLGVEADGEASVVSWDETIHFPWWSGGPITSWLARPVLEWVWRGNLRRLEEILSSP